MTTKKPVPLPISELTLRDYFAAAAMEATMLNDEEQKFWATEYDGVPVMQKFTAERAYSMADAMMAARLK